MERYINAAGQRAAARNTDGEKGGDLEAFSHSVRRKTVNENQLFVCQEVIWNLWSGFGSETVNCLQWND